MINADSTTASWKAAVRSNITRKIAELRKDGTVGMSADNLWMVVKLPTGGYQSMPGSPAAARAIFNELLRELSPNARKFIIS